MESAIAGLNSKLRQLGGIWMPAHIDMVRPFLSPKERKGIVAFERGPKEEGKFFRYYEHPETSQYILAFHREAIPKKPKEPLSRRLLIRKGEQAPIKVPA